MHSAAEGQADRGSDRGSEKELPPLEGEWHNVHASTKRITRVLAFEGDWWIGHAGNPTAIISQPGVLCPGKEPGHRCDGFKRIVCERKAVVAPAKPQPPGQALGMGGGEPCP